jgi:hypothetical protein
MITKSEIREELFRYLARQITLNEFEDWLVVHSWNMHQDSDQAARGLVGAIELRLSEYSADHLNDEGLERELQGLLAPSEIVWIGDAQPIKPIVKGSSASESREVFVQAA